MRVLVTGASGVLGAWVRRVAPGDVEVVSVVHETAVHGGSVVNVDLRNAGATSETLAWVSPTVVLHAAYRQDRAGVVDVTRSVAAAAAEVGAAMLHVSTEAVFCGDGRVRAERDEPDPVNDYGRWKLEAERVATAAVADAAIARIPLLVSVDPPDATVRRLVGAAPGSTHGWYRGEVRPAALAEDVAAGLWRLLGLSRADRAGTWHLPGPEALSRLELGRRLAALAGRDDLVHEVVDPPTTPRPADLRLGAERAVAVLGWDPRPIPG